MTNTSKTAGTAMGIVLTYLLHLALVALAAFALHSGWHLSIPVLPASIVSFFGTSLGKLILRDIAAGWHGGRLAAEQAAVDSYRADVEQMLSVFGTAPKAAKPETSGNDQKDPAYR